LLEGAPEGLDVREIAPDLTETLSDVKEVHHVHAWSLTQERKLVTLHARVSKHCHPDQTTSQIKARLRERFDIQHATVEIEFANCADDHGDGNS